MATTTTIRQSKLGECVSVEISPIMRYGMEEIYCHYEYYVNKETGKKIEIKVDFIKDLETYKEFQKKIIDIIMEYTY